MPFSLVPRERQFFTLFRENAANLKEGVRLLAVLLHSERTEFAGYHKQLRDLEHRADEVTHRVNQELNRTFITPFDREDIYSLASALDDVIDLAEEIADTIVLDCIESINPPAQEMGNILQQIADELFEAFDKLESRKDMTRHWVRIHDLENQADRITRSAIGDLFVNGKDPIYVIKWKDVYALLEKTVDRTEDVANILEAVTIKNA
jgi:predicted phosphate transport protein (TIGR00153 family)